jgi:hypothetical protein
MTGVPSVTSLALFKCRGFFIHNPPPKGNLMAPQAGWILQEEVLPRLRSAIPRTVSHVGCEDAGELVQDASATAAKMLHSVNERLA